MKFNTDSAHGAIAVTPSDSVDLIGGVRALYVGGSGDLSVIMEDGTPATFAGAPAGILSIAVSRVNLTGTTATDILALL